MEPDVDILLVEDDPDDVVLILRTLRRQRVANPVTVANDGLEALEHLSGGGAATQLILLNLYLPQMGGLEVLRRLKADPHTQAIPVILLLAAPEEYALVRRQGLHANGYLIKPFDFRQFSEAVGQAGGRWRLLSTSPPSQS